jgi:hypothetical protein
VFLEAFAEAVRRDEFTRLYFTGVWGCVVKYSGWWEGCRGMEILVGSGVGESGLGADRANCSPFGANTWGAGELIGVSSGKMMA